MPPGDVQTEGKKRKPLASEGRKRDLTFDPKPDVTLALPSPALVEKDNKGPSSAGRLSSNPLSQP